MNLLANLITRLRSLFRREREDDDSEAELRFHLEMETEKNVRAGMSRSKRTDGRGCAWAPRTPYREAVRDARGARPLEDLLRDFGYALRGARRNPAFTLAAIVSLAIPIGFNTTLFTIVDSVLFRPLPTVRPAQLVDGRVKQRPQRIFVPPADFALPNVFGSGTVPLAHAVSGVPRPDSTLSPVPQSQGGRLTRPTVGILPATH